VTKPLTDLVVGLSISLPTYLWAQVDEQANRQGETRSKFIRRLVEAELQAAALPPDPVGDIFDPHPNPREENYENNANKPLFRNDGDRSFLPPRSGLPLGDPGRDEPPF